MSAAKKAKYSSNLLEETHEFEWEVKNFKNIYSILDTETESKMCFDFTAGSEIGLPSKWSFYILKRFEKGSGRKMGLFLRFLGPTDQPSEYSQDILRRVGDNFNPFEDIRSTEQSKIYARFSATVKRPDESTIFSQSSGFMPAILSLPDTNSNVRYDQRFGFSSFLDHRRICHNPDDLPVNEILTIHLNFSMHGDQIVSSRGMQMGLARINQECRLKLKEDLLEMLDSEHNSDITIQTIDGNQVFKAHRSILSARSPVFYAMFQNQMQESKTGIIVMNDISAETMNFILKYIYSGTFEEGKDLSGFIHEIIHAAEKYALPELKKFCDVILIKYCNTENAMDLLKLARLHGLQTSVKDVSEYMKTNFNEVLPNIH